MFKHARAKQLLDERGRTRKWLARNCGLKDGTLKQYLNGFQKPGIETTRNMARLLEVPLADLDEEIANAEQATACG